MKPKPWKQKQLEFYMRWSCWLVEQYCFHDDNVIRDDIYFRYKKLKKRCLREVLRDSNR